jgi:pyrrolidone-carboxylate peptidase
MFEVDYQDTWNDFWNVTAEIHPFAIISFGAGAGPWEIEYNARNLASWVNDGVPPYQPTPCPPDDTQPAGFVRHSSLPVQAIADAVSSQTGLNAWVDWEGNPGAYLCEFIAYLGMWYHDSHNVSGDAFPCRAAGFIHVNAGVAVDVAMNATKITIRETIEHLSSINIAPEPPTIDGPGEGTIGEEYTYTVVTTDADLDEVLYDIDWGDGMNSGWIGPYVSGEETTVAHAWDEEGTYLVKAKARDVYGAESDWGTWEVTITGESPLEITIQGGVGVSATITNTGTTNLTSIDWSITLDGTLIFIGKSRTGTIDALAVGESVTVKDFVIGFGKTGITVVAGDTQASASGTALLFFVIGVA